MNEIEKQKYFTLTDAVNTSVISTSRDIRDIKPIKDIEAPKYKTLTDAVREFRFNQEVIDDIQKNLNEVPEATVGQKIKAGGENWLLSLRQTPESVRNLIYRHFQGMEYPNATSRQAFAIAEASAIRMNNEKALLQMRQTEEGTANSVIANLTSGALSVGEFALMGLATGGLGYTLMGAQEAGDLSQEFVSKDIESGKIYEAGYKGQSLKEVIAADTYGAVAGWIEKGLGVEQSISKAWLSLAKQGAKSATKKSIGEAVVKESIGEGLEEFLQGEASWTTGKIIGKEDKDFYEGFQDSLISGVYGAILGGAFGGASTGLENGVARYYQARQDMALILMNKGIDQKEAVQIADNTLTSAVDFITTELEGRNSLQTYFGEDWNKLVDGVAQAYISQGWEQRFPDKDVREFAEMNAKAMVAPVIELSNRTYMPLKQILDLANFRQNENALFIDMPNVDDPKALTKEVNRRKEEVKRLKSMPATKATDTVKRLNEQIKILNLRLKNLESYNAIEKARMDSRKANLDNDLLASTRPEIVANLGGIRQAQRGESFVYVGNNQVPVRYVVKPMAEVQASHIAGEANPNYTLKELQNRTRGTVTDDAILQNRAANLKPEELAESPNTQYGAPVVNKNGEVISGNGRMETLRRAYELGNTSYKEMLDKLGYNTEGIERPVLVRETIDDLTPEQQVAIAEASNVSETSAFDHARQAMNDAKLLKKGISDPVTFADELPVSERQAYIRENGKYDLLALQRRFDDAVLAWIIGDTKTFDSLVLANRLNQKVIKGISMQGGNIVEFSKSNPTLGIKKDLRYALVKSASIKTRGHFIPAVQQQDIEEGITFNADALLYAMTFSNNSSELSNFIGQYVQTHQSYIDGQKDSFLADSLPKLSKEDITNQVLLNNPLTASKFDKDGTCTDSNLKAVILNRIPVENVGYGTIKIEPEESQLFQEQFNLANENARLDDIYPEYKGETININGQEKTVYNSNGDRIAKSKEALENFYRWFGDSKVVDEQGRPLVVYHGTSELFDIFDIAKVGTNTRNKGIFGKGFYSSNKEKVASSYRRDTKGNKLLESEGYVMPLYYKLENPFMWFQGGRFKEAKESIEIAKKLGFPKERIQDDGDGFIRLLPLTEDKQIEKFTNTLKENGYDGVIFKYSNTDLFEYVAFNPNQIKSTSNRGTYSLDEDNIYYQFAGENAQTAALDELNGAKQLEADGVDNEEIRQQTGWFKGADGKWRFEISDKDADFNKGYNVEEWRKNGTVFTGLNFKLETILKHDKLFDAYPFLRKVQVVYTNRLPDGVLGNYDDRHIDLVADMDAKKTLSVLMHEIQHAIQEYEGFARGGNYNTVSEQVNYYKDLIRRYNTSSEVVELENNIDKNEMLNDVINVLEVSEKPEKIIKTGWYQERVFGTPKGKYRKEFIENKARVFFDDIRYKYESQGNVSLDEYLDMIQNGNLIEIKKEQKSVSAKIKRLYKKAFPKEYTQAQEWIDKYDDESISKVELYRRLYGEVEARNTQSRMDLTEEERRAKTPESTQDVANADAIVVFDDGTAMAYGPETYFQSAFAGSRVDYYRPSLEAIGSGEGNQAHGWGLYYALIRDVAERYRERFTAYKNNITFNDKTYTYGEDSEYVVLQELKDKEKTIEQLKEEYTESVKDLNEYAKEAEEAKDKYWSKEWKRQADDAEKVLNFLNTITESDIKNIKTVGGQVHEVDIPENPYLLDEQKSYREQSDFVIDALQKAIADLDKPNFKEKIFDNREEAIDFYDSKIDEFEEKADGYQRFMPQSFLTNDGKFGVKYVDDYTVYEPIIGENTDITGEGIYSKIAHRLGSQKEASQYLEKYGIKGITYYGRQDGRCFVIFNPNDVKVIQKFYQRGKANINGYFDGELKTIVIGSSFNFGTLQHEFAHFFLKRVFDIYKTGAGTQEFNDWFSQLSSILDIKADQFTLTTPQQEQFARMTESYLFNKAEFPEGAKPAMQMFFDWCPAEYNELLSIGWKDDKGIYHNSVFNEESLDFFNDMYSLVPELGDSPIVRTFTNETNRNGTIIPADTEQRKEREKLIGETPVETVTAETTQASINIQKTSDPEVEEAYKEAIETEQARKKTPVEKFTQYVRIGRGTNTREEMDDLAQDYIKKHRENAERVAFGNPIPSGYEDETGLSLGYVENNTGIDRAVLILNLMNEYTPNSPEYNQLYHNFAIYRSYASKSAGLTNDVNTNYYLKGYVEINKALTQKAALVKYGKTDNAVNLWNRDIDRFISQNIDKVYNTEPESAERDKAITQFIDDAKAMFGSDESLLLQEEIRIKKAKDKQAFIDWANRVVKQIAKGKMPPMDEAKLMDLSVKAQKASKFIDSNNVDEAVAASQDIRAWQDFVNQKGLPESFVDKIIGTYLPSAMLSSPSTHALNAVSNFFNNVAIRAATRLHYGSNVISGDVLEKEYNRLKAIYAESGHNLSEDHKPDDVSRLHGEHWQFKKPESALGYLSPMRLLGWSDFFFKAHTYVDTLARIASQDAKGDPKKAIELFNEYKQMNSVNQRAKEARLQAIMTGHIAVFTNNGTLANISAGMRHYLDFINLVEIGKGGHKGLGTLIMPFAKVPANIVGMGIQAVSSPFKLLGKWTGLKKDWTIQDSIALTNFGLFSSIVGIYLMAGLDYEPPYEPPHNYDPNKSYDSIKIGGAWVSVESFGALANPLRFTFTMLDMISNGKKVEPSLVKAIEGLKNDIPFTSVEFDNDFIKRKPADWLVSATYNQLSKAVPAAVKKPIAWTNRALGLQIEQDSALKRKIARQYGLDGKQTTINDYLTYIYRGIKVDTK